MPHAEPRRYRLPALHPAEDPGNGAQVFQPATFRAPCRPRPHARVFEFVHRGRLLEIFQDFRILRDVFTIKPVCILRHGLHRLLPALCCFTRHAIGIHQGLKTRRDHDFQIPLCQHGIGIFPGKHFALFGNPNLSRKISSRLREDGCVRRPAASTHRAAASMKKP